LADSELNYGLVYIFVGFWYTDYAVTEKVTQKGCISMFDMKYSGKAIAKARRAKNMTQMELADTLNISYQAVSNWERGVSMPDISKLPELSEIFGVSVDEILGKESRVIADVLNNGDFECVNAEEIEEAAPLLKPDQIDMVVNKVEKRLTWRELRHIMPLLTQEKCEELFRKEIESEDGDSRELYHYARYIRQSVIDEYFRKGIVPPRMAMYASTEAVDAAAWILFNRDGLEAIRPLRGYMSQKVLERITFLGHSEE